MVFFVSWLVISGIGIVEFDGCFLFLEKVFLICWVMCSLVVFIGWVIFDIGNLFKGF